MLNCEDVLLCYNWNIPNFYKRGAAVIYSLQNELILRAKTGLWTFFESTLRQCSSEYIEYKFNDSTRFANITRTL